MNLRLSAIGCLLLCWGCGGNSPEKPNSKAPQSLEQQYAQRTNRNAVVHGNTAFALDLYQQIRGEPGNLFLSPHSISTSLAMTYAGARGETEQQMARALHFTLPQETLHPAFADLQASLNAAQSSDTVQLSVANSLWPAKDLSLKPDFLAGVERNYQTRLTPLDYGQPEVARKTINRWVENQTRDKIKDLIQPGVLGPDTVLVLANAIYFKGRWLHEFKPANTLTQPFHLTSTSTIDGPMMHQRSLECGYHEDADVQVLELPYRGERLSMVVLLPAKVDGLAELEEGLTAPRLEAWLRGLSSSREVNVWLPKFKTTSSFTLNRPLTALGMVDAFGAADFSGMFAGGGPAISEVVHKAFVEVNEEGTEAAAATGVIMKMSAGPPPATFRADHPFLFFIRDRITGSILFLGRIQNPTQ